MHVVRAHRSTPCAGQLENGDIVLARESQAASIFGVVDALGHGPRAAEVARAAARAFEEVDLGADLLHTLDTLHRALVGTRGAAVTFVRVAWPTLTAVGVGNVALRVVGAELPFFSTPGVVGARMHRVRLAEARLTGRVRVLLASDGVSTRLDLRGLEGLSVELACERLFAAHAKGHDDATLFVADVSPPRAPPSPASSPAA